MLREIRRMMEKNRLLSKLVPIIYTPRLREMRSVWLMNREKPAFLSFYQANRKRFDALEEMLEDDLSRETLRAVIRYRSCPKRDMLKTVAVGHQYFVNDIFSPMDDEVFIDGGAYVGQTVNNLFLWMGGVIVGKRYIVGNRMRSAETSSKRIAGTTKTLRSFPVDCGAREQN